MATLRSQVIRLAHARPELRPHLLPLLKEAAWKAPALNKTLAAAISKKQGRQFSVDLLNDKLTGKDWQAKLRSAIGTAAAPKQTRDLVDAQAAIKAWTKDLSKADLIKVIEMVEDEENRGKSTQRKSKPGAWD